MIEKIPQQSQEFVKEELVALNFRKMTTDMQSLLRLESVGGNAGYTTVDSKRYSCAAANTYVDKDSGEIKMFGNFQDIPEEVVNRYNEITFRVAYNLGGSGRQGFFRIVEVFGLKNLSQFAQEVINASVEDYNSIDIVKVKKVN